MMIRNIRPLLLIAALAIFGFSPNPATQVTISDEGCMERESDGVMIYRYVIEDANSISYLEEIPCGSGNWHYRTTAGTVRVGSPAVFDPNGNIILTGSAHTGGRLSPSATPGVALFTPATGGNTIVITSSLVEAMLHPLQ
jgi:hypothetical protein